MNIGVPVSFQVLILSTLNPEDLQRYSTTLNLQAAI